MSFLDRSAARVREQTARSFSEARAEAERWTSHPSAADRIQHITSAWKGHEHFAIKLVEYLRPEVIVELGVDHGFSTFALALPNIGTVHGIDCFEGDRYSGRRDTYDQIVAEKLKLGLRNIVLVKADFSEAARSWDRDIDVLHIDGDHDYESVKRDFAQWVNFVRYDGIVLMHDTVSFPDDVGRLYDELPFPKFNFTHSHGLAVICRNRAVLDRIARL